MDPSNIGDMLHALKIELLRYRYALVSVFMVLSASVLLAGYLLPKTYTSKVTLYADVTNIIGSLLQGKAEITEIDRAQETRDTIFTDRILRSVARKAGFNDPDSAIRTLRGRMQISANGDYVFIEYSSSTRDEAFRVIDAATQTFLSETARKKREESQSAFEFIDVQVSTYKQQLAEAESRLKDFSALNIDITEQNVSNRVTQFKNEIQILKLNIQDSISRLASFETELAKESEFLRIETERSQSFEERQLETFEQQLADLRLTYLDNHPDIISLKDQVESLRGQVAVIMAEAAANKNFSKVENPSYTSLKGVINTERADLTANRSRLSNIERLLTGELSNAQTVAAKQATRQELSRDYAVTKEVYEDMLKRRESARLSMTLDIEGQGVSYKIHEPASYPLKSNGLQLVHFALLGPLFGLAVPLGLIVLLVLVDPRIRSAAFMTDNLPADLRLITTIPMYNSAIAEFTSKLDLLLLGGLGLFYLLIYALLSTGSSALTGLGLALALGNGMGA
jgi:polysaccharide chain length determinant protein (PEP-CTERM system associated)